MNANQRSLLLSLILLLLAPGPAWSQTFRGGIAGSVADPTGAAIPNAKVTIVHEGTGFTRSQDTTASGDFSFQDLPLGKYIFTVAAVYDLACTCTGKKAKISSRR